MNFLSLGFYNIHYNKNATFSLLLNVYSLERVKIRKTQTEVFFLIFNVGPSKEDIFLNTGLYVLHTSMNAARE